MDDFLKQFRENLNRRPAPDFKESDWLSLQERLDPPPRKQVPAPLFWWVFLPVLMASLATNGLLFQSIRQHGILGKTVEIHCDTVFLSRVVYQTDTVFQTRIIRQTVFENRVAETLPAISAMEKPPIFQKKQLDSPVFSKNKADSTTLSPTFLKDTLPHAPVFLGKNAPDSLAAQVPAPANKKARKNWFEQVSTLRPKYFEAGFSGGATLPLGGAADWQIGPALNLQALVGFSKSLRLQIEGGFSRLDFNASTVGAGLDIPSVAPPADDFRLASVEGSWSNLQCSAAMQWLFRPEKRWRPLLGLGLGSAWRQPFQATYDFKNEATGVEWIKELDIAGTASPLGFGLLTIGVERSISKKWSGQLRANGRLQLGSKIAAPPSTLDVQAGLKFCF